MLSLSSMIYLLWNGFSSDYFKHEAVFRITTVQMFVRLLLWSWQLSAPLVESFSLSLISDELKFHGTCSCCRWKCCFLLLLLFRYSAVVGKLWKDLKFWLHYIVLNSRLVKMVSCTLLIIYYYYLWLLNKSSVNKGSCCSPKIACLLSWTQEYYYYGGISHFYISFFLPFQIWHIKATWM